MLQVMMVCAGALLLAAGVAQGETLLSARAARQSPDSVNQETIYQVWMRSFTPEGTLKAATARLPHIADLGASVVYLSPINLQSAVGGFTNPYRIKDYGAIDPEYGTEADLRALVTEAHRLHLKVLMDIVYYHTGPDSVLLAHPEYYQRDADGNILLGTWKLPCLNFANDGLRQYLIRNLVHWLADVGVDGFRFDVSGPIPVDFWEQARAELDRYNPNAILLGESDSPEEQLKAFDCTYNFSYYDVLAQVVCDGAPASDIRTHWEQQRSRFPRGARQLHLSDNHDRDRAAVVFGSKGALATSVLNFTLDGIPFLYNGQEVDDATPTNHLSHAAIRWDRRGPMAFYQRLFRMRKAEATLTQGELVWIGNSQPDSVVSFVRRMADAEMVVLVNLSNRKLTGTVEIPLTDGEEPQDVLKGQPAALTAVAGKAGFTLGAFDYIIAKRVGRSVR